MDLATKAKNVWGIEENLYSVEDAKLITVRIRLVLLNNQKRTMEIYVEINSVYF